MRQYGSSSTGESLSSNEEWVGNPAFFCGKMRPNPGLLKATGTIKTEFMNPSFVEPLRAAGKERIRPIRWATVTLGGPRFPPVAMRLRTVHGRREQCRRKTRRQKCGSGGAQTDVDLGLEGAMNRAFPGYFHEFRVLFRSDRAGQLHVEIDPVEQAVLGCAFRTVLRVDARVAQ